MAKIRTGLIGCGKIAAVHADALASLPGSRFVAVCGTSMNGAGPLLQRFGVRGYDDVEKFARESGVEAVCVATPHPQHALPSIACLQAGVHVLVEKPLAASLEDCDRMIAASRKSGATLGVISQRRFYPPCRRIRAAIDAGKIGKPVLGAVTMYGWRDAAYYVSDPWRGKWEDEGGGVLVNQSPHQLDLLLWYMGPAREVCGFWGNLNHPTIEVEDTAVACVRFKSGGLGQILVTNSANPALYGRVQINGSNGASIGVQTDGGSMFIAGVSKISEPPINDVWTIPDEEHLLERWKKEDTARFEAADPIAHYHGLQIEDFLQAVMQNRAPAISAEEGRRTVELFTAIYRSTESAAIIRLPIS